jgi:hypothetical protein
VLHFCFDHVFPFFQKKFTFHLLRLFVCSCLQLTDSLEQVTSYLTRRRVDVITQEQLPAIHSSIMQGNVSVVHAQETYSLEVFRQDKCLFFA